MEYEDKERLKAVRAVITIAGANFPDTCEVTISTKGKQSASVTMLAFELAGILADEKEKTATS